MSERERSDVFRSPADNFLGRPLSRGILTEFKNIIKQALDFERITPVEDLKCGEIRKILKLIARKVISDKN